MKKKLVVFLLASILVFGCVSNNPQQTNNSAITPSSNSQQSQNAGSFYDVCSSSDTGLIVTNQELASTGWSIELANATGTTVTDMKSIVISTDGLTGETGIIDTAVVSPGLKFNLHTQGSYPLNQRVKTKISFSYHGLQDKTIEIECLYAARG